MGVLQRIAPGRSITPETNLDDLGLSSLERVELMTEIERIRGGSVDESAVAQARSVSELLSLQERKEAEPAGAESFPRWSRSWPAGPKETPMPAERINHRCECGASFVGHSVPPRMLREIYEQHWLPHHQGDGHRKLAKGERRPRRKATEMDR